MLTSFFIWEVSMKNKMISFLIAAVLLFSLPITAFADGDGNVDGGGGGMGQGTSQNSWTPGNDGVRVTVIKADTGIPVSGSFDYTKKSPSASIFHFGKTSKIQYRNGNSLSPIKGGYAYKNPAGAMPTIVSSNGSVNIEAVKRYFCSEGAARMVANDTGIAPLHKAVHVATRNTEHIQATDCYLYQ